MRKGLFFLFFLAVLAFSQQAKADPGDLDTSFGGGDGIATVNLGAGDLARSVIIQPDGKILVSGSHSNIGVGDTPGVVRFNADGSLDNGFGGGDGIASPDLGAATGTVIAMDLLDNGQIITGFAKGDNNYTLALFNSDGSPDLNFGTGGEANFPSVSGNVARVDRVFAQPDGKIVASAIVENLSNITIGLARTDGAGNPDSTFGGPTGTVIDISFPIFPHGLAVLSDGKILLCAESVDNNLSLLRFNNDGTRDGGFGNNGAVGVDFGATELCFDFALQSDGKIVMGGTTGAIDSGGTFTSGAVALARINGDGTPDTSFGNGGKITHNLGTLTSAQSLAIQANGKIVSSGTLSSDADLLSDNFMVARYNPDGTLDTTFGNNGSTVTPVSKNSSGDGLALAANGDLVVVGFFDNDELDNDEDDFAVVRYLGGEVSTGGGGGSGGGGCQMSPVPPRILTGFLGFVASLAIFGFSRFRSKKSERLPK